jgi:hypothetical protein
MLTSSGCHFVASGLLGVYPSYAMDYARYIDTPFSWAIVGFIIGVILGVNNISVILLAVGLGLFLLYLKQHGPAEEGREGWLFAGGPSFIIGWTAGFVVHGLVL